MAEKLVIEDLSSGAEVTFKVRGYMTEPVESEVLGFTVPKHPARIDFTKVTYSSYRTSYEAVAGTASHTVTAYWFQERMLNSTTPDPNYLNFIVKVSASPNTVVAGDYLQFAFSDTRISHLNVAPYVKDVSYINRNFNNLQFVISKSNALPRVVGDASTSLTGVNRIIEVTASPSKAVAKEYAVTIEEERVYSSLILNETIKQIPIFAFSQSDTPDFTTNSPRYLMTPNRSTQNNQITITNGKYNTPSYFLVRDFEKKQSNRSFMTDLQTKGRYFRFYVALAEYRLEISKISGQPVWYGYWLQTDSKGNPIWEQAVARSTP